MRAPTCFPVLSRSAGLVAEKKPVRAEDVARLAGVSRAAVSRTFTPGASVSQVTRDKVMTAAEKLGYQVNHLARGLTRSQSGIVALIASDIATPYRSELLRALTEKLQAAGLVAMLINTDRSDSSVELALRQAIRYRTNGAIILSGMPDGSITELCRRNGQRLVLINRDDEQGESLMIRLDDSDAAADALTAFIRAGCTNVALATSEAGTPSLVARERSFLEAAAERGLTVMHERFGPTSYESGLAIGQRLMLRKDRPDAVFCTTDLIACGVMDAARRQFAAAIPDDLCVIGFDDIHQAAWESYRLTTFRQPIDAIAEAAVAWIDAPGPQDGLRAIRLSATIVWRQSVRAAETA